MTSSGPLLIDTHCHLDFDYEGKTTDTLVAEARKAGVGTLVTIGTAVDNASTLTKIAERYPEVYFTVGVHPHDTVDAPADYIAQLRSAAQHPKCRAIGEIGLDYHYAHSTPEVQRFKLKEQLALAAEMDLPVSIHSREAEDDLYAALAEYCKKRSSRKPPGVIHCFSGTQSFGLKCVDLGFYISFSGILTFKKSEALRLAAQQIPLQRLVVETDAPFLAPEPMRGKKCEPAMVVHTTKRLAGVHGVSFEEMAAITTENAKTLFSI